ncbi:MAG: hypothetical protein O3C28_10650 [Proteobacteria bacterium]|nr:hypothetical protein [Pseudomonadota bacterium]
MAFRDRLFSHCPQTFVTLAVVLFLGSMVATAADQPEAAVSVAQGLAAGQAAHDVPEEQLREQRVAAVTETEALDALVAVLDAIKSRQTEIKSLLQELKRQDPGTEADALQETLESAKQDLKQLRVNFESIATGIAVKDYRASKPESFDLQGELVKLAQPLVYALNSATRDSRDIETLRQLIEQSNKRIRTAQLAIANLRRLMARNVNEGLTKQLKRMLEDWERELETLTDQNQIYEQQLQSTLDAKASFLTSTGEAFTGFVRNRGVNALLGLATFMAVFGVLRFLGGVVKRMRATRRHTRSSFERLTELLLRTFSFIIAITATLVVFNLRNDWLLLGIGVLFLGALGWVAVKSLPTVSEQFTLLLNLGSVREGERLIYQGLPWRVTSLNLYSHLENPWLTGGSVHLAIRDLVGNVSRISLADEPWFPSREGDWVKLDDGFIGEILHQSPEMVVVRDFGNCQKTYTTQNYLGLNPMNLSSGYRIQMVFGIDYRYQADGATRIPETFKARLTEELNKLVGEDNVMRVEGDFFLPNASSLDYEFEAYIKGDAAHLYEEVERTMIYCFLNVCNENHWEIPFQQVTIGQRV